MTRSEANALELRTSVWYRGQVYLVSGILPSQEPLRFWLTDPNERTRVLAPYEMLLPVLGRMEAAHA